MKMKPAAWLVLFSFVSVLTMALGGCEAVFTYSPVAFLQRNPDNLSTDQQKDYYQDMTASGTITDENLFSLDAFAQANATDPAINKLAGNAYLQSSGINTALQSVVQEVTSGGGVENISLVQAFQPAEGETVTKETVEKAFEDLGVDVAKFKQGAAYLSTAKETGATLSETDQLIGGVGLALTAVDDVATLESTEKADLKTKLDEAGSFDALVVQAEAEGGGLTESEKAIVLQVKEAQDFLDTGMAAIQSQLPTGDGEETADGEEAGDGEDPGSEPSLPAGLDMTELFAQLLESGSL